MDDRETRERVARVESLLEAIEDDPAAIEAVAAVVELYGEGLRRVVEAVDLPPAVAGDELVEHLLLLHDLHPIDTEARVQGALDDVRPYLNSHGGDVELLGIEGGVARVRLQGSCDGCPSSAMTLRLAIEDAVGKAAPELEGIEAENVTEEAAPAPGLLQIGSFKREEPPDGAWTVVGSLPQLSNGGLLAKEVGGEALVFLTLDGSPYAYRDMCPGCSSSLAGGTLDAGDLACPGCGRRYDARRAGRCLDEPQLYLEPVPLLVAESGIARVSIPAAVSG